MNWIDIFERPVLDQLLANHKEQQPLKGTRGERDFVPAARLFIPWMNASWILTECDPGGIAFGLCDLAQGAPELGSVDLQELADIVGPGGLRVEQDRHFTTDKRLSVWASDSQIYGRIMPTY